MKSCTNNKCEQVNPQHEEAFYSDKKSPDGKCWTCSACMRARANAHSKSHYLKPEVRELKRKYRRSALGKRTRKAKGLETNYGITIETFELLKLKQEHKCAICGCDESKSWKGLHVDHCHKTGIVRGLLCCNCNQGLGKFKDDTGLLTKAIGYLQKPDVL